MNRIAELKAANDDDLYSGYNEYPSTFDIRNLENDEVFQAARRKSSHERKNLFKPGTAYRSGLLSGHGLSSGLGYRGLTGRLQTGASQVGYTAQATALVPKTGVGEDDLIRPMTAVRGVGYTSHGRPGTGMFDPINQKVLGPSVGLEKREETPEEKVKKLEREIMGLIEESASLNVKNMKKQALSKAKEASSKERNLIRIQEHSGLSESHNLDLTFLVLFNLASQYTNNEMYTEALNTYVVMTKNKMFSNASRLKVNMGNIYFKLQQYNKAIKMYRMAMDQVPNTQKDFRIKIMHNIGTLFLKTGEILVACNSFEYIMQEKPDFRAALQLVYCYQALNDPEKMKKAFLTMLNIPLNLDFDKYNQDDPESQFLMEVIKNDKLRQWEKEQQEEAERSILIAAKLMSPIIEETYAAGYNWCLEAVKSSKYASLASTLDLDKAIMLLKQSNINGAVEILKVFQDKEPRVASIAANNLSFISYLEGDLEQAEKWGESSKEFDSYNASAYVNLGNVAFSRRNFEQAKEFYEIAYENDSTCVEALYNLGLVNKHLGQYEVGLGHFMKLETILRHEAPVLYQLATLNEFVGDVDQATEWYLQLLGVIPSDPGILQEIGQLFEREGDKQQAFQYHFDSYRYYPSNFDVLDWLGSHYMSLGVPEKALPFYKRAIMIAPNEPKWHLLVASCYKKIGNHQKAVEVYKNLHKENPDNIECLQLLVQLSSEFGMKEASDYALELKRAEKAKEVRERIGSSRSGSRRSSGRSAGFTPSSPTPLRISPTQIRSNPGSAALGGKFGQFNLGQSISETDEIFESMSRPKESAMVGMVPPSERPRTSAERKISEDDFGDDELGDDLLPE
ncbi:hypothetical protein RUM43_001394 [Polyplax serrata]|uniref:Uncharacterized protein n=1 Tax=Polyplax serrata TaxID=468196 RepID=A0AAN8SDS7_POLSC